MVCGGMVPQGRQAGGWAIRELWVGASSFPPSTRRRILKLAACRAEDWKTCEARSKRLGGCSEISRLVGESCKIRANCALDSFPRGKRADLRSWWSGHERTMHARTRLDIAWRIKFGTVERAHASRASAPPMVQREQMFCYGADEDRCSATDRR